jgi:arylsulfatase A-like enzyme
MNRPEKSPPRVLAVLALAALLAVAACSGGAPRPEARLNVLLITIDTLRADRVGGYGGPAVPTPAIDGLAGRGALFLRAFAHSPQTLPSHASILIGTTPLAHGVHDNIDFVVGPRNVTLAELLKARGYATAAFVSASVLDSRFGLDQGFDVYDDAFLAPGAPKTSPAEQKAETTVEKALSWLGSAGGGPWFLWIHIWDPHTEYAPPEPFATQYRDRPYDGEVAYADFALGRLFQAIEASGAAERTLTVLTADHGEGLGDHGERTHGYLAHNATIWVPLIIAGPKAGPSRPEAPVSHSDIVPTVLDILGVPAPPEIQGRSLRPALAGKSLPVRPIYFECLSPYYEMGWAPMQGYVAGSDKFVRSPLPELYDLDRDFGELNNLAPTVDLSARGKELDRLIAGLTPATPPDSRAATAPELKERLASLGYVARSGASSKTSFTAEDDAKTLLPLLNRITDAYDLKARGQGEEAVRRLEAIIREPKTLDAAYVRLADLYLASRDQARALDTLAAGWRRFPSSYDILSSYVAGLVSVEKWPEVVRVVGEAPALPQLESDGVIPFFQGLAYQKLGDVPRSIAALEKAVAADGEYFAALFNLGASYLGLSLQTGDPAQRDRAVWALERATALDPGNAEALTLFGRGLLEAGQADRAIAALETARKLAPELANIDYQLGLAFLAKRDFGNAYVRLVAFRERVFRTLTAEEKAGLDALIRKVLIAK